MWELLKDFLLLSLGMGLGVFLMCLLQVGRMADERMEQIKTERGEEE